MILKTQKTVKHVQYVYVIVMFEHIYNKSCWENKYKKSYSGDHQTFKKYFI